MTDDTDILTDEEHEKKNLKIRIEDKIRESIGEILIKEKYKFLPFGLVGEIIRDFIQVYNKKK